MSRGLHRRAGAAVKVSWGGAVHLAEARYAAGWARLICNAVVLPSFTWEAEADDEKLTCADCRAIERRQKKERESQA